MLGNKVALITGAAHRIGASTAQLLHAEGMNLVLHYRSSREAAQKLQKKMLEKRPDSVILVQTDLRKIDNLPALVKEATDAWGRLDVLINNASTFYQTPINKASEKQWDDLMSTNLKAPFFLSQAAAAQLKKNHGCIINMVDIHAERPLKSYPIYSMAKAGLVMMTRALACELGPEVRVNGVAPGAILWPENTDDITKQRIVSRTFLKRKGEPGDIASAILYLIRDARYMSGQVLTIDGGRSLNS
ncbi:FolM Alternative dihydrofolate reductase 1 [hydrothermal vent metagenome]|uniref:FolM Alternative dihydrofolate reductase 1 n=1 Tax=hydrothermal vent metagenome TaxID=652676 RepID=A0A3B1B6M6_9ZZZZ